MTFIKFVFNNVDLKIAYTTTHNYSNNLKSKKNKGLHLEKVIFIDENYISQDKRIDYNIIFNHVQFQYTVKS